MGRGLSDLQKSILRLVYENHVREQIELPTHGVTVSQPLVVVPNEGERITELGHRRNRAELRALEALLRKHGIDEPIWNHNYLEAGWAKARVQDNLSEKEAEALAKRLEETEVIKAFAGSLGQQHYPAIVFDDPKEKDFRSLAPEAFDVAPDGFWYAGARACHLMVGRCRTPGEADALAKDLCARGLQARAQGPGWPIDESDLYFVEALVKIFGCLERFPWMTALSDGYPNAVLIGRSRQYHGRIIDRARTGEKKYRAAAVSLSKAIDRLEARNLITGWGYWRGQGAWATTEIMLTPTGLQVASELMANTSDNSTSVSHYEDSAA